MIVDRPTENFSRSELGCHCCGTIRYHEAFIDNLDRLRCLTRPLHVISGSRCIGHNEKVGGHKNSLHLIDNPLRKSPSIAVDVSLIGWDDIEKRGLLSNAKDIGLSAGLKNNSIHLDFRELVGLDQRIFLYGHIPEWAEGVLDD